jgi:hypothetical protein
MHAAAVPSSDKRPPTARLVAAARGVCLLVVLVALLGLTGCGDDDDGQSNGGGDNVDPATVQIATQAYIYGYAPVAVAQKAFDQTHPTAGEPAYAPVNALYIDTNTATPDSQLWVSPNVNVLYASTHLDLAAQPVVLFTPEVTDRYFSWEIMDAYTNAFAYVGSRATQGQEGTFALVGPDWTGQLPAGYTRINCPTNSIWMVARIEVTPGDMQSLDLAIAQAQDSVLLRLDAFINRPAGYVNPIITKPPMNVPALDTNGLLFFTVLNDWLTKNPPPPEDAAALAQFAKIGVGPGFTTKFESLPLAQRLALQAGITAGSLIVAEQSLQTGVLLNGWFYNLGPEFGDYGTDYLLRAEIARAGLGANINQEAIYPTRLFDQDFLPLLGDRQYTITFRMDELPVPVNANGFWSVTMYDRNTGRLVANPINRYSLGNQNDLFVAADGSITLDLQPDNPGGDAEANWLPTPQNGDPFYLLFRAYYPDNAMIMPPTNPDYKVPELRRVGPIPQDGPTMLPPPLTGE